MELELRSSYHTIRKVLDEAEKDGVCWPLPNTVTYEILMEVLFPEDAVRYIYTQFCEKYRQRSMLMKLMAVPEEKECGADLDEAKPKRI